MKVTFIIATGLLATGCSSASPSPAASGELDADGAKKIALAVVAGTTGDPELIDNGDEHRWSIPVTIAGGAKVSVEITRATSVVEEIKGEVGPFDYDLPAPKAGQLSLASARTKALAIQAGTLEVWEMKPPGGFYEFYVRDAKSQLWEVKLAADSGTLLSELPKDQPD